MKRGEGEAEDGVSGEIGKTHSRIVLVGTCLVSRRVRKHRRGRLSLASWLNALTIDILPPRHPKCFEMFCFCIDMEMEHFCDLKIFHRADSSFPA